MMNVKSLQIKRLRLQSPYFSREIIPSGVNGSTAPDWSARPFGTARGGSPSYWRGKLRGSGPNMANAAVSPASVSEIGNPARSGALPLSPVTLVTPESPWTIWS